MRKLYSLLIALLALCGVAQAQTTVTFVAGTDVYPSTDAGAHTLTKDGVTIALSNGTLGRTDNYRIYKGQTITVSSTVGSITGIKFTCIASNSASNFAAVEGLTVSGNDGFWTGSATEVTFTAEGAQVRATKIEVTLGPSDPNYVAKPTITPASGTYYGPQEVTITAGEGCKIFYSVNGESAEYTAPFTISGKGEYAISAYAQKGDNKSETVSVELTIAELQGTTIAQLIAAGDADQASTSGTVYAAYARGFLLGDATGFIFVYGDNTVSVGDQLVVSGEVSTYGGCYQISNATLSQTGTEAVTYPAPKEIGGADLDALVAAPAVTFVKVKGKLTSTGNYKNFTVEGATAIGSVFASDAVFGSAEVGDEIEVTGYFVYQSSNGKYGNILATEVKVLSSTPVEVPEYSKLADVKAAATADQVKVKLNLTDILVSYVNGSSLYLFDGTDGLLIYGDNADIKAGDKISGSIGGMLYLYNGLTEIVSPKYEVSVTSSGNEVPVQEVAADVLAANKKAYESELVLVKGLVPNESSWDANRKAVFEYSDDNDNVTTVVVRDNWRVATGLELNTDDAYDVTGFVAIYNSDPVQIYPRSLQDLDNGSTPAEYVFDGEGTLAKPYSVADVLYLYSNNQAPAEAVWVSGFIVGAAKSSMNNVVTEQGENLQNSNIVLADAAAEEAAAKLLPVQLPAGAVRDDLNLVDHFNYLGQKVYVLGQIEKYFSVAGVKSVSDYSFDGVTTDIKAVRTAAATGAIYNLAGQRVSQPVRGLYIVGGKKVAVK